MLLTIVGCAGSFPGPDSPASCYLVEADGFRVLLDLGNGALGALQRFAPLDGIDAICLSHLHGDHCLDMSAYAVARQYRPGGPLPPVPVYGPPGTEERLSGGSGTGGSATLTSSFRFTDLAPGTTEIGPLRVTAEHVDHPVETFGLRLEHAGRSLAYSADTGETPALVSLARGADVLLCEASFLDGPGQPAGMHLTAGQAGEHAHRAGAGQLVLTHLVAGNDPGITGAQASATFGGPVTLAATGLRLSI